MLVTIRVHAPAPPPPRQFLKDPKSFSKLGARPPKGILLEGDPGGWERRSA